MEWLNLTNCVLCYKLQVIEVALVLPVTAISVNNSDSALSPGAAGNMRVLRLNWEQEVHVEQLMESLGDKLDYVVATGRCMNEPHPHAMQYCKLRA